VQVPRRVGKMESSYVKVLSRERPPPIEVFITTGSRIVSHDSARSNSVDDLL
jgi:hypothetical protein